MAKTVAVVDYGMGNLRSVSQAVMHVAAESGHQVLVTSRPEDVLARPISAGDDHVFDSTVEQVDFLGAFCHVHVRAASLSAQPLTVVLSLNFLAEQSLVVGSALPLRLLPERLKIF